MNPLTDLEKQGLTKCDKCSKLMSEFGAESYNFNLFCHKYNIFNKHIHICLKCGNKIFGWIRRKEYDLSMGEPS